MTSKHRKPGILPLPFSSCKSIQMRTWHLELQQLFYNHEAMNSTVKSQCSRNIEAEDALGLQELPTSRPES